jgi:hypothetical protein
LKREYGRARRGAKAEDSKRGKKFHRVNVVAGQIRDGSGERRLAPLRCQGTMKGSRFEEWFEKSLLKKGNVLKLIVSNTLSQKTRHLL